MKFLLLTITDRAKAVNFTISVSKHILPTQPPLKMKFLLAVLKLEEGMGVQNNIVLISISLSRGGYLWGILKKHCLAVL